MELILMKDKNVSINLSVDKSNDNVLGYEIYRNGKPCGFIERDKGSTEITYTDVVDNINNRVVTYSAIAYDYNDIHSCEGNEDLKLALDDNISTAYEGRILTKDEYNSSVHLTEMNPNNNPYLILDTTEIKTLVGIKYTAPVETSGFTFKKQSVASTALKKFKIEVSKDGSNWTTVKEGTLDLTVDNPTETIFFDQECTASIKSK